MKSHSQLTAGGGSAEVSCRGIPSISSRRKASNVSGLLKCPYCRYTFQADEDDDDKDDGDDDDDEGDDDDG